MKLQMWENICFHSIRIILSYLILSKELKFEKPNNCYISVIYGRQTWPLALTEKLIEDGKKKTPKGYYWL
jgi:hypothetical protein